MLVNFAANASLNSILYSTDFTSQSSAFFIDNVYLAIL